MDTKDLYQIIKSYCVLDNKKLIQEYHSFFELGVDDVLYCPIYNEPVLQWRTDVFRGHLNIYDFRSIYSSRFMYNSVAILSRNYGYQ